MSGLVIKPKRDTCEATKKNNITLADGEIFVVTDKRVIVVGDSGKDMTQLIDDWYSPRTNEVIEISEYYYNKNNMNNLITASSIVSFVSLISLALAIMNGVLPIIILSGIVLVLFTIALIKDIKDLKELKKPEILVDWEKRHRKTIKVLYKKGE